MTGRMRPMTGRSIAPLNQTTSRNILRVTLADGRLADINAEGRSLSVFESDGKELFTLAPPEHAAFYQFVSHAEYGECPIVSFEPGHTVDGWMVWYYRVDVDAQRIERLNPWR